MVVTIQLAHTRSRCNALPYLVYNNVTDVNLCDPPTSRASQTQPTPTWIAFSIMVMKAIHAGVGSVGAQ